MKKKEDEAEDEWKNEETMNNDHDYQSTSIHQFK